MAIALVKKSLIDEIERELMSNRQFGASIGKRKLLVKMLRGMGFSPGADFKQIMGAVDTQLAHGEVADALEEFAKIWRASLGVGARSR